MYRSFEDFIAEAQGLALQQVICVAGAADERIRELCIQIVNLKLGRIILVDTAEGFNLFDFGCLQQESIECVVSLSITDVASKAVEMVRTGKAQILVKGRLNSQDFLRAVLDKNNGLREDGILSVLTCYDVPKLDKLLFLTDGGMVVAPTVDEKALLIQNAVSVLHRIGIAKPKVALLSANERVSAGMQSSVDASELCRRGKAGLLPEAIYEGPIALDVALRLDAAQEKKLESQISGDVDLLLVPNIDTGNCLGKAIGFFGDAETAGIVVGAACPVVMSSRAASIKGKLASIAWALLMQK